LGGWTAAVASCRATCRAHRRARDRDHGLISVGFLLFIITTSNPFERLLPPAVDGRDLNPLLQDRAW